MRHKIAIGQRCGKVRFGFDLGADGKTLVRNEDEQAAIELMRSLRMAGSALRTIASELASRGIATKERTTWSGEAVRRILGRAA